MNRNYLTVAAVAAALAFTALPSVSMAFAPETVEAGQLQADANAVNSAVQALNSGGYPGLAPYIGKLRDVVGRGPESSAATSQESEVYGVAALLLTMNAVEGRQYEDAVRFGTRAVSLMPQSSFVASELASAYQGLRKPDQALAVLDAWLARNTVVSDEDMARIQRSRGFSLIELSRLDEAEAAYRQALKLEPGHKGVQGELDYIDDLRSGAANRDVEITTSDKARDGE